MLFQPAREFLPMIDEVTFLFYFIFVYDFFFFWWWSEEKDLSKNDLLKLFVQVYRTLGENTKGIEGVKVENHKFCTSVHYRNVEEKGISRLQKN